jgi:uncharacterized RDD family membrane protein YckC
MILAKKAEHEELTLAGFGRRLGAWLIDTFLLLLILLITRPFPQSIEIGLNAATLLWGSGVWILISAFYFIIFWTAMGQTIGSLFMDIKIIRRDGRDISWKLSVRRFVVYIIALIPLGFGLWCMIFDRYNQTWADHAVKTVVVKTPKMKKEQRNIPTAA